MVITRFLCAPFANSTKDAAPSTRRFARSLVVVWYSRLSPRRQNGNRRGAPPAKLDSAIEVLQEELQQQLNQVAETRRQRLFHLVGFHLRACFVLFGSPLLQALARFLNIQLRLPHCISSLNQLFREYKGLVFRSFFQCFG